MSTPIIGTSLTDSTAGLSRRRMASIQANQANSGKAAPLMFITARESHTISMAVDETPDRFSYLLYGYRKVHEQVVQLFYAEDLPVSPSPNRPPTHIA